MIELVIEKSSFDSTSMLILGTRAHIEAFFMRELT